MKNKFNQKTNKRALVVSPYLDHLGGGERYMLQLASIIQSQGYQVYFAWNNADHIVSLAHSLGIKLDKPKLHPQIYNLYFQNNPLRMYLATKPYDLVIYLSDGSIPLLGGQKNIIHMQVPFHDVGGKSFKNQLKLKTIDHIIVNSQFTKTIIDHEYQINSQVIYPPVNNPIAGLPSKLKQPMILSVGRFEASLNIKKQDVLIEAFKQLSPHLPNWKFVLVGSLGPRSDSWVQHLRQLAKDYPIEIKVDVSYPELQQLYQQASIYWHAAGYQVDENTHPELVEHFGITTVEAILSGCLPLVVPKGGQKEIVASSVFHWQTISELIEKTINLTQTEPTLPPVDRYSLTNFENQINQLLSER